MAKIGRPSIYDEAKATFVLDEIANGSSIGVAAKKVGIEPGTFEKWCVRDYNGFRKRYFEAFGARCILEADKILEIVDDVAGTDSMARVQAARTRADMRRWLASRILAEFNDRVQIQTSGRAEVHVYLPAEDKLPVRTIEGHAQQVLDKPDTD